MQQQQHHLLLVAASVVLMAGHTDAFRHPPFGAFSRANPALRPVASHDGGGVVRKSGIGVRGCSNLGRLSSVAAWSPKVMSRHVGHARCSGGITALALPAPPFSHTLTIDIGADQQHRWREGHANAIERYACARRKRWRMFMAAYDIAFSSCHQIPCSKP